MKEHTWKRKGYFFLVMVLTICSLAGCGPEAEEGVRDLSAEKSEALEQSIETSDMESTESHEEVIPENTADASMWGYDFYTGYLDECVQWTNYRDFVGQDYDNDGQADRIYREELAEVAEEGYTSRYRVELSTGITGGQELFIENMENGTPHMYSMDLDGDNAYELLFLCDYEFSSRPDMTGLDVAFFDKIPNSEDYQPVDLPFDKRGNKYYISFASYKTDEGERAVTFFVPGRKKEQVILPEKYDYGEVYDSAISEGMLYQIDIHQDNRTQPAGVAFHFSTFWDEMGELVIYAHYENNSWVLDEYEYVVHEFYTQTLEQPDGKEVELYVVYDVDLLSGFHHLVWISVNVKEDGQVISEQMIKYEAYEKEMAILDSRKVIRPRSEELDCGIEAKDVNGDGYLDLLRRDAPTSDKLLQQAQVYLWDPDNLQFIAENPEYAE